MMKFQAIETKQKGFRCPVRVVNHSGDDILTTFDPSVDNSVQVATKDLQDFWQKCVDEFKGHGYKHSQPKVFGKRQGEQAFDLIRGDELMSPEFDLTPFEDVMVQPVPLTGG